ncbi:glycerophosphodiester phosphodiesterase [Marinilactibacillus sp. GCM10026970]|uniref:glycerophosphodiester phosphodiesterase n=1 Tax=Marinilactibacillus sp. GCM10026970 TaxID=3252642 RepID=UPI00361E4C2F
MLLTAHSGSDGTPNNSLEFLDKMIDYNVDCLEIDVRRAQNGQLYLSHDAISSMDSTNCLLELDAAFKHISKRSSKILINCDLKEKGLEAEVQWTAEKRNLFDQVLFSGTVEPSHLSIWDRDKILYNIENCLPNIYKIQELKKAHFDVLHYFCKKYKLHTLNLYYGFCTKEWIELCHQNNIQLSVWTVDNLEMIQAFEQQELYNVTSKRTLEYIEKKGARQQIGQFTERP